MESNNDSLGLNDSRMSRTDLDSHVSMEVVRKMQKTREIGMHANVAPFTTGYYSLHKGLIADTTIDHDD